MMRIVLAAAGLAAIGPGALAQESQKLQPAAVSTIETAAIAGFDANSPAVKALLTNALALTKKNLGYQYGSADPAQRGMDCSGTVYYLLRQAGLKGVPRSSDTQYAWTVAAGTFHAVKKQVFPSPEFADLLPGDLLFWSGTYAIQRENAITHAMIYLGRAKSDGLPLMVGSSDGRTYRGVKRYGVSVFDFRMPSRGSASRFVGYARDGMRKSKTLTPSRFTPR